MIDLHIHTRASDGSVTPLEVVKRAKKAGLEAVGITDHDSVDGINEFLQECAASGIEGVGGIEISVRENDWTIHLLGYYLDPASENLRVLLEKVKAERTRRSEKMIERLDDLGLHVSREDLRKLAGDAPPGRPHLALLMKKKGLVTSVEEAFSHYLKQGGKAYIGRYKPDLVGALSVIHMAGGIAVLAHPVTLGIRGNELFSLLTRFKDLGLEGVEVYHPAHDREFRKSLIDMAGRLSLAITGGSDFHGDVKPEWKLGIGLGDMRIPYDVLDGLKQKHAGMGDHSKGRS